MSGHRSIESLRRLAPVSDADAAAVFGAGGREELLAGIATLRPGRSVRRRRLAVAGAVLVLAVTATAATWAIVASTAARETTSVECVISGVDTVIPSSSGDPAYDCAVEWQREQGTTPPPLAAYDNGLGGVTVIPRSQKPQAGWKPLQSQDVALIELQESLDDVINGLNSSCLNGAAATRLAEAKLAQFGFTGWTATVRDPNAAETPGNCVSGEVIDPATQTVTLIPMGGLSAAGTGKELAAKLQPATKSCQTLAAAVASVRAAGSSLGLSAAPPLTAESYDLSAVSDDSLRCASIYETVGGTIFITVRGPSG